MTSMQRFVKMGAPTLSCNEVRQGLDAKNHLKHFLSLRIEDSYEKSKLLMSSSPLFQ